MAASTGTVLGDVLMKQPFYAKRVHFRLIQMPCCGTLKCWVNPRLANYCPECGAKVYMKIKTDPSCILVSDLQATLKYHDPILTTEAPDENSTDAV